MAGGMNRFDGNRFGFLVPFEAERWRFKQVGRGEVPDFFTEAEPPDFSSGRAAFGSRSGICSVQAMVHTDWDLNTDMLLRRTIPLPPDASIVQVFIGIDNDFMAFWNGTEMRREEHEGCPAPPDFVIQVPDTVLASRLGKASDLFAIRAIDRGGESFVDVSISWVSNRPAPQP